MKWNKYFLKLPKVQDKINENMDVEIIFWAHFFIDFFNVIKMSKKIIKKFKSLRVIK